MLTNAYQSSIINHSFDLFYSLQGQIFFTREVPGLGEQGTVQEGF